MKRLLVLAALLAAPAAGAEVYRWVDAKGTVHYSNAAPPEGVNATRVPIDAHAGPPSADSAECYTVRCQGERMEKRLRLREEAEARAAAERAANAPPPVRGLEFRRYIRIEHGMSEGELLVVAGEPDFIAEEGVVRARHAGLLLKTWTYLPTSADPFTTTITLVGGRVSEVERVRKF